MLTLETLAAMPAWPMERLAAIEGTCAGSILKDWAANLNRRWGADAEQRLREELGPEYSEQLPSDPSHSDRLPAWLPVRTSDIVIASFLDGDALRLEDNIWEDIQRSSNAAATVALRLAGPKMVLKHTATIHQKIYSVGTASADVSRRSAVVHTSGSPLFGNPTWQLTQIFLQRMLLQASRRDLVEIYGEMPTEDSFTLHVTWK